MNDDYPSEPAESTETPVPSEEVLEKAFAKLEQNIKEHFAPLQAEQSAWLTRELDGILPLKVQQAARSADQGKRNWAKDWMQNRGIKVIHSRKEGTMLAQGLRVISRFVPSGVILDKDGKQASTHSDKPKNSTLDEPKEPA